MLNITDKNLLDAISGFSLKPENAAFNVRKNGQGLDRRSTEHVQIVSKTDKPGIDINVLPGTKKETVFIPVIITETGVADTVYNDFYIGEDADVTVIAGCGIHNSGCEEARHDGVHRFFIGKNARVKYIEKHYGEGDGTGGRVMNPVTEVFLGENAVCEMETAQIGGIDSTLRETNAFLEAGAKFNVTERLMTHGDQTAKSNMRVELNGKNASSQIVSRSVAKDRSEQVFNPVAVGNAAGRAHVQCDSIIMDKAKIRSIPEIAANDADAEIIHEAAIGRINNDQLLKLMTFGMSEEEAENVIIEGFLK